MGSPGSARKRGLVCVLALSALVIAALVTFASAAGPGGWDHVGTGNHAGGDSLDATASALAVSSGVLYVGGGFTDAGGQSNADRIAMWDGSSWSAVGPSAFTGFAGSVNAIAVSAAGDVYAGGNFQDAGGEPDADNLAVWDGASWKPFCDSTVPGPALVGNVTSLQIIGPKLCADYVAYFDGTNWRPLGSNGTNDGPLPAAGLALALIDRHLYAAGSFTSAGGDPQARAVASFALAQIIAYPTPTVTQGPGPVPTPTVTPTPDATPPRTSPRRAQINQATGKATFRFGSGEQGSTFSCKLDARKSRPCTSPKSYKGLKPGKHAFRVKARDRAGNLDATPAVKRFKINKR